jgi:hypothetical protein
MEEKNNLPARLNLPPEQLTEQKVKAFYQMQLSRKDYQQTLQGLDNVKPTKDNLPECNEKMKKVNKVITELLEFAKATGTDYFKAHRSLLKGMNDLLAPILSKVAVIEAEMKARNNELLADLAKAKAEQTRIDNIKNTMVTFINNCTAFIGAATTDKAIANIQMRIGTEKSRTGFYAEFHSELLEKCNALTELINERKDQIRKDKSLAEEEKKAIESGDSETASGIREQREQLESDMEENILRLQEKAFEQISNDEKIYVPEPAGEALKGRNYWRWEVVDMLKLYKKSPGLVILEPNKEAIEKVISDNKEGWVKEKKTEVEINGIKFFIKKYL